MVGIRAYTVISSSSVDTYLDILPIIELAIESPTHNIVDASLRSLPVILPVLDFSTIKNELFPVIASVFSKTSSLGIKVRGLEAFVILCGGSNDPITSNDGLDGIMKPTAGKKNSSSALDKYTMQEKIIPLIKGIKTKEPAVAIAALNVLRQVGAVADSDFIAMDILPILWDMSLGPLLDLKQFQSFMDLIKSLSSRVEAEQTKKLQELSGTVLQFPLFRNLAHCMHPENANKSLGTNGSRAHNNDDFMSFSSAGAFQAGSGGGDGNEVDFERLVKGNVGSGSTVNSIPGGWDSTDATTHPRASLTQSKPGTYSILCWASYYLVSNEWNNYSFGKLLCHWSRVLVIFL